MAKSVLWSYPVFSHFQSHTVKLPAVINWSSFWLLWSNWILSFLEFSLGGLHRGYFLWTLWNLFIRLQCPCIFCSFHSFPAPLHNIPASAFSWMDCINGPVGSADGLPRGKVGSRTGRFSGYRSETHWCGNSRVLRDRGCCWTWKDMAATGSTKSFLVGTAVEEAWRNSLA